MLKGASLGSKEHKENMEHMAKEVVNCIGTGIFKKERIQCFRGIGSKENFIFHDEELKAFMLLSDVRKKEDHTPYQRNSYLENTWSIRKDFKSTNGEDYCTLYSTETACLDKYSTTIFRETERACEGVKSVERFDRQLLPDYHWWKSHGDWH